MFLAHSAGRSSGENSEKDLNDLQEKARDDTRRTPSIDGETDPGDRRKSRSTDRRGKATRLIVAAAMAWTVFLALHLVFAGRWWPWSIFEMIPPLAAVVIPLLLLAAVPFARSVRTWLSPLLVLLLVLGAAVAGFGRGWTTTARSQGTAIKVFAWNADYWEMKDDETAFYAFLRKQRADIYLLQEHLYAIIKTPYSEVIRIDDSARLRAEFPGYRISVEGEFVTLSRLPIVAAYHQRFPNRGTDWFWKGWKFQRTDIRVGGRTVSFYNVHLPTPFLQGNPLTEGFYRRQKSQSVWRLKELDLLRADLAANPHPIVMAGDFNSPWAEFYFPGTDLRVHSPTGSFVPSSTWQATDGPLPRLWRLDWLYTTNDLIIHGHRIGDGNEAFSDHAPQEFHVVVPERRSERQVT